MTKPPIDFFADQGGEPVTLADVEAERRLLAAMLRDNGLVERLSVTGEDFYDPNHRDLWEAARGIIYRGESASVAVLAAAFPKLQRYIARLPDLSNGLLAVGDYARTVRDFAIRRQILSMAIKLQDRAGDTAAPAEEIVADAAAVLSELRIGREAVGKRRVAEMAYDDLSRDLETFPTGLASLDQAMGGGLVSGKLYGIGARKKVGKSILMGTISHNLNRAKVPHLFIPLEMSSVEVEQRNIGRQQGFNAIKFLKRDLPNLRERVGEYVATVPDFTLFEHAPGATFDDLRGIIGRARLKGIKGVILDYLQLVQGKTAKDTEEFHQRRVAQWLADIARQTGLWILTAAQLNQDDNVRGGEGLKLACDQYYVLHREKSEAGAWLEMEESRYTLYQNVGSDTMPGFWLRKYGPHFSDDPPHLNEWPSTGAAA